MIPLTLSPECEFTFNSQEEQQELGAISELSNFAMEASHVGTPWQQAEGVLGHFVEQKPRQKKTSGSGPPGAATVAPVLPVWPDNIYHHDSVEEDAWRYSGDLHVRVYPHFPGA